MFFKKSIALLLAILMVISFCVVVSAVDGDDGDDTDDDYYYQSCGCDSPTPESLCCEYSRILGSNSHGHIWGDFEVYQCCNCNGCITIIVAHRPEGHYGELTRLVPNPDGTVEAFGICEECGNEFSKILN